MTLTRNYQARTNDSKHISQRINMDTFAFGDESYWVRQYQYDAMGNVTKIYGETPDCHDYTYDYRNFLVNDNGTAYEYDGNGNITKKGATTFTYDTVIKDRLVKVGNTPVTYSTANPLNPATYGNCSYNFKGRRLQSFTKSGSTYNYIYDEQGLRTRKIAPDGSVTKYLYNGTKLAAEIAPNYRLDFLYDENDMLYGFVKDGSAKYFYARDMLQNILGIIDTNGSPVVIYQYTAYGTSTVLQDTAGLANINPFRYKGYYFDSESGMYYCHTRYYVPEWCRWLNADHPSFLQPDSLQGMNLFVYCGNDPVMYTDTQGTNEWSDFWNGIGGLIVKILGGAILIGAFALGSVFTGGLLSVVLADAPIGAFGGAIRGGISGLILEGILLVGSLIGTILMICLFSIFEYALIDIVDSIIPYETSKLITIKRFTPRLKYNKVYSNKIALLTLILQVITSVLCISSIIAAVLIALFLGDMPLIITASCVFVINTVFLGVIRIAEVKLNNRN